MPFSINFWLTNRSYQIRISQELLTDLAVSLLNDTKFETVMELIRIQVFANNHLLKQREQIENEYQREVAQWTRRVKDAEEQDQILQRLWIRLQKADNKLLSLLDHEVVVA